MRQKLTSAASLAGDLKGRNGDGKRRAVALPNTGNTCFLHFAAVFGVVHAVAVTNGGDGAHVTVVAAAGDGLVSECNPVKTLLGGVGVLAAPPVVVDLAKHLVGDSPADNVSAR